MDQEADLYLLKAEESYGGADSELANRRFNNSANRCYYACFQAAIAALLRAQIRPPGGRGQWGHDLVRAQFNGQLINRRKLYPPELREVLERTYLLRQAADYRTEQVGELQVGRALRRVRMFLDTIQDSRSRR